MIFIENDGVLYRGISRGWPKEIWSRRQRKFVPYTGRVPKPIEWGYEINDSDALAMMMGSPMRRATALPRSPTRR
jgi:hypothetical protein